MRHLLFFGIRFLGVSLLIFALWRPFTTLYPYAVAPVSNLLLRATGAPIHLMFGKGELSAVYDLETGPFRVWMGNQDVVYLNLVVLVGLFGAWRIDGHRRSLMRLGTAIAILWVTHVIHVYFLTYTGLWHYFRQAASAPGILPDHLQDVAAAAARILPDYASLVRLNLALDFWRNWGMMSLAFLLWLVLVGPRFGIAHTSEENFNAT